MIIVIFLFLFTLAAWKAGAWIRKHNRLLYLLATLLSLVAFLFKDKTITLPFIQGFLGLSFFYLVMVTGAFAKTSTIRKKLMGVRKEYSILGFIVITPHALTYLLQAFQGARAFEWFGIIAFALMIPLFLTSFMVIRKKMKAKSWKQLQSLAYLIYLLLFVHLILNYTKTINLVLYLILFLGYFLLKGIYEIKAYQSKRKQRLIHE